MTTNKSNWLGQDSIPANKIKSSRLVQPFNKLSYLIQHGIASESKDQNHTMSAHLTPLDDRGQLGPSTQIEVRSFDGRDISFHHPLPLASRRAFVSIEDEEFGSWEALVELGWCRFNRMGNYTSGGRFVRPSAKSA